MAPRHPSTSGESLTIPELPSLDSGLTLLAADNDPRYPLQTLMVDHLLLESGSAVWVGTGRYCTTDTLVEVAPDRRVLDRVDVARGFTPYQHTALVRQLEAHVDDDTEVIVLPDVDAQYGGDDLQGNDGRQMLVRVLARLAAVAREHDIPILCTRSRADQFSEPIEAAAASGPRREVDRTPDADGPERIRQSLREDLLRLEPSAVRSREEVEFAASQSARSWISAASQATRWVPPIM
jgi:hypothetical protein